jgi:hypothetical protein
MSRIKYGTRDPHRVSAQISGQPVVNMCRSDSRVAGRHRNLMEVGDDIAHGIKPETVVCECSSTTRHPAFVRLAPRRVARSERTAQPRMG